MLATAMNTAATLAQSGLGTGGIRQWILDNLVPLLLLTVALLLLWLGGGKGDNAGVMKRVGGVFVALAIIGLAVTGSGVDIGRWIASLFSGG
ncbi:hypothetical protein [Streptoalloteichus hindustanus]|uniref:TrbC/VIRB2 family protein n=1 Tax=Streptoalloteichus hindustanus TaxID=2017 RepID=A0A1M5NRG7_STRHI|nr:hypothetical protein [Streptoalloteichus hindustanus]SHG91779.1 hypothetical protein SAMN05444320_11675 [Streptoalloteichus hindustanus]